MKKFEVYKNIRKQALIFGLPLFLFALMILSIIASLLVIIFSFSFGMIIGLFVLNTILYLALTRIVQNQHLFQISGVFPKIISNKKTTSFHYE